MVNISDISKAIAYFETAIRESNSIDAAYSPELQAELAEQKKHFITANKVMGLFLANP